MTITGVSCEKRVRPRFCLRRRGERGSTDGTQRSQDGSDRHRRRGAGDAGVHGACLPVMKGKHTRRDAAHFLHEPFQFPVVLDPLPVQAEFVFGELQADGLSARLARPVVVRAVTRLRVVVAATGGPPTRYPAGGASSSYGHGSALLLDRPRCRGSDRGRRRALTRGAIGCTDLGWRLAPERRDAPGS